MSTLVTRAGKGSPLTHNEVDANFNNLNTDKIQSGNTVAALTITSASVVDLAVTGITSFDGAQGTAGQVLTSAGTGATPTWTTVDALPSQTGNSGKYLTTNGTNASWATVGGTTYSRTSFTATASQTTFTVSYTVGLIQVYVNGVLLNGDDYTASNGTSVVLAVACNAGDIVEALAFSSFSVASTVSSFSAGTTGLTPSTGTTGNVTLGGTLAVANGGTGVTTSTGSGAVVLGTSPTISGAVLNSMASSVITSGTNVATTSGTSIDFTSIPSWVKRITVMFNGVSTSSTTGLKIQVGSGSVSATGYLSACSYSGTAAGGANSTTGFTVSFSGVNASTYTGNAYLTLCTNNTWTLTSNLIFSATDPLTLTGAGKSPALGGALDRIRISAVNGTDTFDAGSINILYE